MHESLEKIDDRILSVNFIENDIRFWGGLLVNYEDLRGDCLLKKIAFKAVLENLTTAKMWMNKIIHDDFQERQG